MTCRPAGATLRGLADCRPARAAGAIRFEGVMADQTPRNFSNHQQKIISRYYDNRDQLDEQKLSELVTNLYLATTEKQKQKYWQTAEDVMTRLEVPKTRIAHILEKKDPAVLAAVVQDFQTGKLKKPGKKPPEPKG